MTTAEDVKGTVARLLREKHGKPVGEVIWERYQEGDSRPQIAEYLGIAMSTLQRWEEQLGITRQVVWPGRKED